MRNKIIFGLGSALLLILAVLSALSWTVIPSVDRVDILARARGYDAEIRRDEYGVPHIFGVRDADVAFGLGFAHSEDDFETIALTIAMARGDLGRFQGTEGAQTDYLVHLFRNWDLVDARYETDLAPETRALVEAYADGINLYGVEHGEGNWRGILPVRGKDIIAGYVFRMPFFFGFEQDLAKIFDPQGFVLAEEEGETTASLMTLSDAPIGSNAIALAPSRSAEGVTRLAVNSHQPFTGPVAWYEAVLQSDEGWHMAGGTFPGGPLIIHGHNETLGWANTVNHPDLTDVYKINVNPDNENEYLYDGEWKAFDRRVARLRVRLFGPLSWTFKREALYTDYGPAIRLDHGTFAVTHAAMNEVRQVEQMYRLNKAKTLADWQEAMRMQALPSTNFVYADQTGNIAYYYNAKMPRRPAGFDWKGLLPGDTSRTQWQGFYGLDDLPHLINPDAGFLLNSNNVPFKATDPGEDLEPGDFPASFGISEPMTNRALRGLGLLAADPSVSKDEFYTYRADRFYHAASPMMQKLERLKGAHIDDPDLAVAVDMLRGWSGDAGVDSTRAALGILTGLRIYNEKPKTLEADIEILRSVTEGLQTHHGRLDVPWGTVNRIRRGAIDLPVAGGPDTLRAIYGGDTLDASGTLTAFAGDTFIMMVEWDKAGAVRSESVHQFGSATLDETSPHYGDQVKLFADEGYKPVWFYEADLAPHVVATYRPGQDGISAEPETGE